MFQGRLSIYRLRSIVPSIGAIALVACGAGGGGGGSGTPQPGTLQLSIATQSVSESTGNVTITVTRTGGSGGAVSATLATANGTAIAGQDFTAATVNVAFSTGDATAKTISIAINNDALTESDESFTATLSAATGGATIGAAAAITITIQDNDIGPASAAGNGLNDTGVTICANGVNNGVACNSVATGTDQYPDQDAQHGRDFTSNNDSDGHAGFSFTKLDGAGAPLANQSLPFNSAPWTCVLDNVTGLTWEVKSDDGGLRDKDWTYSWLNSTGIDDDGDKGVAARGQCSNSSTCDTEKYVAALNNALICGQDDWRLPTRSELLSLGNFGAGATPLIAASHFPDLAVAAYWSASNAGHEAASVDFVSGEWALVSKRDALAVRAVVGRGGR